MEAMWTGFNPLITEVKELIRLGEIGEIISFSAELEYGQHFDAKSRLFNRSLGEGLYMISVFTLYLSFSFSLMGNGMA